MNRTIARPRLLAMSLAVALAASGTWTAPPSHAAVTLGETFTPEDDFGGFGTLIQSTSPGDSYAASFDGVITSWSYQPAPSDTPPPLKLKVVRPEGGDSFTTVGDSELRAPTPDTLNTFPTRIPVQASDVIGYYFTVATFSFRRERPGYATHEIGSDPPPGTTPEYETNAGIQVDVAATLEPDADSDGFGDETQDDCPTDASTQGPCPPDDGSPPPDDVLPSNDFSFGKVKKNKKKGTAKLTVKNLSGPGELELAKNKKVKGKEKTADAGKEKLPIKPKGKAKKKLNSKGKAKVKANVTFTPDGGTPNTEDKKIKLVKR